MNILVLGANGMAGHMISQYLKEQGHEVTGFAREESICCDRSVIGDAMDQTAVKKAIESRKFETIINAVGILNQAVNRDLFRGIYLNSAFPHYVKQCAEKIGARLLHISTDCVFSGRQGRYTETSEPDESSYYGRTKVLGEVKEEPHLTIRTSIVGPELKADGIGLFHWFMKQTGHVNGFTNVLWSGVTTLELAKAIEKAICENIMGLYHLSNNEEISKYRLLNLFNYYMRKGIAEIRPEGSVQSNKSIVNTRTDVTYEVPGYEEMIEALAVWMKEHNQLYQQYGI